jgi:hypothetical protein
MTPVVATGIFTVASKLVDRLFPDKAAKDEAKLKLVELQMTGELAALAAETDLALGQMGINKTEAASDKLFVAGWRPSVGWICSASLAYQFVLHPFLGWAALYNGFPLPPSVDTTELMLLLGGMLGFGTLRTYEKFRGVQDKH